MDTCNCYNNRFNRRVITMKIGQAFVLFLCAGFCQMQGIDVSGIDCGNVCAAKEGQPYSMSCVWTGALVSGIVFSKGGFDFLSCSPAGICFPSTPGYASGNFTNSTGALFSITSFNSATDSGVWSCSDGSGQPQSCSLPKLANGSLQGECTKAGSDFNISCYGITEHGIQPARIDLMEGNTTLASATSEGSVSSLQTDAAGKTYSCSVTGDAALCLTPRSVDVTCPGCLCEVGNIIFIVLLLICLVSKFGSDIYFLTHNYFPKKKYRNPSVGVALETTIEWTEEHRPQHSAYNDRKKMIENEIKGLCGDGKKIQILYFEDIKKQLRISFHLMEEDVICSTFSNKFAKKEILSKEIKNVTEQKYHIHEGRFELFKNGDILVNKSKSTACKVSLEYNCFLFPVITLKSLTDEGQEIRKVKKSHPVCVMGLLTILTIIVVVAALIFFLVCSLQELAGCPLGIGVIVLDGIALILSIVNIIVLAGCRDWIWITGKISIDVELTTYGNGTGSGGSQGSNYNKTSSSESITHPSKLPKQNKPTDRSDSTQAPVYDNETLRKMKKEPPPQPTSTDRHSASSVRLQVMETPKQSE